MRQGYIVRAVCPFYIRIRIARIFDELHEYDRGILSVSGGTEEVG